MAFRSVIIPAKAILMNLLSVGAAYGLVTPGLHQEGWGASLSDSNRSRRSGEQWVPLFLFAILFGLSMDYQVFLLSRVQRGLGPHRRQCPGAVREGVGATAGIITGAALIMVAVFAGFASGDLVMFQQVGFGLGRRRAARRHAHPHPAGPRRDEAARSLELVPAELAGVAAPPEHRGCARRPLTGEAGPAAPGGTEDPPAT